jgi:hypothetical protein
LKSTPSNDRHESPEKPSNPKTIRLRFTSENTAGALGISFILHFVVLLLVGGHVIFKGVIPKKAFVDVVGTSDIDIMELPPETEAVEDIPAVSELASNTEPAPSAPASSPDILISTGANPNFTLISSIGPASPDVRLGTGSGSSRSGQGSGTGGPSNKGLVRGIFGSPESASSTLRGTLYDLKMDKARNPIEHDYNALMSKFAKNQDKAVFAKFYQVARPLYNTHIYMPMMPAVEAPKAFGVENEIQPSEWIVHYEGVFTAPKSGTYRFAAYADDVILVAVNGKLVADGSRISIGITPGESYSGAEPTEDTLKRHRLANGYLGYGKWFNLTQGVPTPIQVVIGERPGGEFCSFLFIEEKGQKYPEVDVGGDKRPLLPLFRMQDVSVDSGGASERSAPPFLPNGPVFQNK